MKLIQRIELKKGSVARSLADCVFCHGKTDTMYFVKLNESVVCRVVCQNCYYIELHKGSLSLPE